jgi:hypothetical protein
MGDALFHVAWSEEIGKSRVDRERERDRDREDAKAGASEPVMDEDEII